jgi:uncharacterized protein
LAIDLSRIGTYLAQGVRLEATLLYGLVVFIPASFLGAYLAKRVVDRIPQDTFRSVIAAVLAAVAVRFLLFPGG